MADGRGNSQQQLYFKHSYHLTRLCYNQYEYRVHYTVHCTLQRWDSRVRHGTRRSLSVRSDLFCFTTLRPPPRGHIACTQLSPPLLSPPSSRQTGHEAAVLSSYPAYSTYIESNIATCHYCHLRRTTQQIADCILLRRRPLQYSSSDKDNIACTSVLSKHFLNWTVPADTNLYSVFTPATAVSPPPPSRPALHSGLRPDSNSCNILLWRINRSVSDICLFPLSLVELGMLKAALYISVLFRVAVCCRLLLAGGRRVLWGNLLGNTRRYLESWG